MCRNCSCLCLSWFRRVQPTLFCPCGSCRLFCMPKHWLGLNRTFPGWEPPPSALTRSGLHDNLPDRPSARVEPSRSQLATIALIEIETVTIPKWWVVHGRSCHQSGTSVSASGLSGTRLADFLPPSEVGRLGRCRATRPWGRGLLGCVAIRCA